MELEAELRATSDRLLRTLDEIEALENEKRTIKPDEPRFDTLAREIERLAAEVFAQTHAQQNLGQRAQISAERTGVELLPIEQSTQMRDLHVILAEWRDAERRLQLAEADTSEHALASADARRLRDEYHAAYSATTENSDER